MDQLFFDTIQAIPGDTPEEKFKYLIKLAEDFPKSGKSFEELIESQQLPEPMLTWFQKEVVKKIGQGQIPAEPIKSEDSIEAFKGESQSEGSIETPEEVFQPPVDPEKYPEESSSISEKELPC